MTRYDIAKFYGYNSPEEYDEAQRRLHESFVESKKMQKPYVEKEPVKIQPVNRGRWIAENRDSRGYADCYTCTNCNCYSYTYTLMKDCEYEYCPNCGARMDAEPDEPWQSE